MTRVPVRPWQVWWANLDPAQGHEQAGTRPVIVVSSRFHLSLVHSSMITVMPLTTRERPRLIHRVRIEIPGKSTGYAITEQLRTVSDNRLSGDKAMWELTADQIIAVRNVLRRMIDL